MLHFGTQPEKMVRVAENIEKKRSPADQAALFRMIGQGLALYGKGAGESNKDKARNVLYRRTLAALEARAQPQHKAFFAAPD
jgi:hypothetical protein